MRDLSAIRDRSTASFTSAVRETFTTLVFPTESGLRDYAQFRMEFDNNDYKGEEQILKTLEARGKYYPSAKLEGEVKAVREEAEHELFDADAVQRGELRRKAAAKAGWYWLPTGGLDHLIDESVRTKHWRERNGLIEKRFERSTSVAVRLDGPLDGMVEKGVYRLLVVPEDADVVYASEHGIPDPAVSGKVVGRSYETSSPRVWFLPVDSRGEAKTGAPVEWLAPIKLVASAASVSGGTNVGWLVLPRSAKVKVSLDGTDPAGGETMPSPVLAPSTVKHVRLLPTVDDRIGDEVSVPVGGKIDGPVIVQIREDRPLLLRDRLKFDSITKLTDALAALQAAVGATVRGGQVEVGTEDGDTFADVTFGDRVSMTAEAVTAVMSGVSTAAGFAATRASASFNETRFSSGKDYKVFADAVGLDFSDMKWSQDEGV